MPSVLMLLKWAGADRQIKYQKSTPTTAFEGRECKNTEQRLKMLTNSGYRIPRQRHSRAGKSGICAPMTQATPRQAPVEIVASRASHAPRNDVSELSLHCF